MTANRFDQAAEAPILNTYVPINFGELFRIGAAQKDAVEQASREFTSQVQKFGEFQSPSQIDTERWYNNTIGKLDDVIQEAVANPDAMKDAAFRSRFQSKINNLDYATLSGLKQSREGMLARQKANQELMMRGLYNPLWHDVDFTNYDTANGIFNDVSPLAYKSEVDLVKPFVDNLKASFMGVKDGWIRQGVSADRTDYEIQKNLSSIQNTPEYQKHLEVLQKQGLSREQAEEQLNTTLITAGREFAYEQAERDPWWMKSMELQRRAAAQAKQTNNLTNLTTQIYKDGKRKIYENFTSLTPDYMDILTERGMTALPKEMQVQLTEELKPEVIQGKLMDTFKTVYQHTGDRNAAVGSIINMFSSPLDPETAIDTYGKYGTTGVKDSNGNYRGKDSKNFVLEDEIAFSMIGDKNQQGTRTLYNSKFADMWNKGKFHDFIVAPETEQFTDGSRVYQRKYAYVPIEQFDSEEFFKPQEKRSLASLFSLRPEGGTVTLEDAIKEAGLEITTLQDAGPVNSITVRSDNNGNIDSESVNRKEYKRYVRVPVATVIPHRGQAAVAADAKYTHSRHLRSETNEIQNRMSEYERFPFTNLED